jgi:VWFA-related protein
MVFWRSLMYICHQPATKLLSFAIFALVAGFVGAPVIAQQQPQRDDVLRTKTELIQTFVTVVDKSGKFVDGLNREQFQLLIDGQAREISFFDQVTGGVGGSPTNARRDDATSASKSVPNAATVRGRSIVFFVDDLHLSLDSLNRTRKMLRDFLENEMNTRDSVAIVSASGQVGFLQQFTNDKEVLSAAIDRLSHKTVAPRTLGMGNVPMSDYVASLIDNKGESRQNDVMKVYIDECRKQSPGSSRDPRAVEMLRLNCEQLVKSNARMILTEAATTTANTYAALKAVMRSNARAPGRKLAFFISDGFLLDTGHGPALREQLEEIIDSAQRAGVVIYTIDAKGLTSNMLDATNNVVSDPNGRMAGIATAEISATQDALHSLARDTGGRALRNQNYFDRWVDKVLDETSNYYVLAWRPSNEVETARRFRNVQVNVAGNPQFNVRVARGYLEGGNAKPQMVAASAEKPPTKTTPDSDLQTALADYYPNDSLPVALSLTYLNTPNNGIVLTSSVQITGNGVDPSEGQSASNFLIAGVILNDKGKIANSFKTVLKGSADTADPAIIYNHRATLTPGIYQVRVAARDDQAGRVGSALNWIAIPDLSDQRLNLSTLMLIAPGMENLADADGTQQIQLSVDHRYPRDSSLDWCFFIYNARQDGNSTPDLGVSVQVLRDDRVVQESRTRVTDAGADPARIFFTDRLALQSFSPGRYNLLISVTDNRRATTATRRIDFQIQ